MLAHFRDVAPRERLLHDGQKPRKISTALRHLSVGQAVGRTSREREGQVELKPVCGELASDAGNQSFVASAFSAFFVIVSERRGEMILRDAVDLALRECSAQRTLLDQRSRISKVLSNVISTGLARTLAVFRSFVPSDFFSQTCRDFETPSTEAVAS
jgi:hypothetical protein